MYFTYLSLPLIPQNFFDDCIENTKLIGKDPKINSLNLYRSPVNRATSLPVHLVEWLNFNIVDCLSESNKSNLKALFNITTYQKLRPNKEYWGIHPKHIDVGRSYALNYYFTTGGSDTRILWYDNNITVSPPIFPNRWCLLKTDIPHSVKNIEEEQIRYFISIDIEIDSIELLEKFIDPATTI